MSPCVQARICNVLRRCLAKYSTPAARRDFYVYRLRSCTPRVNTLLRLKIFDNKLCSTHGTCDVYDKNATFRFCIRIVWALIARMKRNVWSTSFVTTRRWPKPHKSGKASKDFGMGDSIRLKPKVHYLHALPPLAQAAPFIVTFPRWTLSVYRSRPRKKTHTRPSPPSIHHVLIYGRQNHYCKVYMFIFQ